MTVLIRDLNNCKHNKSSKAGEVNLTAEHGVAILGCCPPATLCKKGIERVVAVAFPYGQGRVCQHTNPTQNTTLPITQQANGYRHSLASGLRTLHFSRRDLIEKIPLLESVVGRQPQRATGGLAQWRQ